MADQILLQTQHKPTPDLRGVATATVLGVVQATTDSVQDQKDDGTCHAHAGLQHDVHPGNDVLERAGYQVRPTKTGVLWYNGEEVTDDPIGKALDAFYSHSDRLTVLVFRPQTEVIQCSENLETMQPK